MKHETVAISGADLLDRVFRDSDSPWRDVIGWNCQHLDELESLTEPTDAQEQERDELDHAQRAEVAGKWWIVTWPEHVINPRYNSDASYAHGTEAECRREADSVYA